MLSLYFLLTFDKYAVQIIRINAVSMEGRSSVCRDEIDTGCSIINVCFIKYIKTCLSSPNKLCGNYTLQAA